MTPGESFLTMDSVADACQARLEALAGTWQRSACRIAEDLCLGALEAETYSSLFVRPDLAPGAAPTADYGAIAYTVPAGWANAGDQADQYTLMRASDYAAVGANIGRNPPDAITVLVNPFAARLHAGCAEEAEPGIGTDRAALTAWILQHPGLVVTQQPDITIDGRPATVLDLEQAEAWTETCPDVQPFVAAPVFYHDYHWALAKNDLMRVVLLDVNPGATTAVTIEVQDPTTYDQLIADAMPIVESLDFK